MNISNPALIDLMKAVIGKGASFRFQAKGFSMSPFIRDGDFVTVSPMVHKIPRLGDVVAFISPESDQLILHRFVGKKRALFYIKGDNSPVPDPLLPNGRVLAKVVRVDRNGKMIHLGLGPERLLIALFSRQGFLPFIIPPLWKLLHPVLKKWAALKLEYNP